MAIIQAIPPIPFPVKKREMVLPVESGLVGYWTMDNVDIVNGVIRDKSEKGNHGTIFGATTGVVGVIKEAFSFDGVDDYVDVGIHWDALIGTSDFTIEAWVKFISDANHRGIVGIYADAATKGLWLVKTSNNSFSLRLKAEGTPHGFIEVISAPHIGNQWHHVVGVGDRDGNGYIYVNGVLESQTSIAHHQGLINSTAIIGIGTLPIVNWSFNGSIDEVRIYNRKLSAEEVAVHYSVR